MTKTIHIHLGPHKTGSSAIQQTLRQERDVLEKRFQLYPLIGQEITQVAESLMRCKWDQAALDLRSLAQLLDGKRGDCVISCEDWAGDLPGRSKKRRPYPNLWKNINVIRKAFPDHVCKFYFFVRNPDDWIKSSYTQLTKHHTVFSSMEQYRSFLHFDQLWEAVLERPRAKLQSNLVTIPYREEESFCSAQALLRTILNRKSIEFQSSKVTRVNTSPPTSTLAIFEAINRSSASREAKNTAKSRLRSDAISNVWEPEELVLPMWPPSETKPTWLSKDLEKLWTRAGGRVPSQNQPCLLPRPFSDLTKFRMRPVAGSKNPPFGERSDMKKQLKILSHRFNGQPRTCLVLGLTISYLRRNTEHTEHAAYLFHRLWEEEHEILLATLPTRWLISTFQTFIDHGENENQRMVGSSAYFYSNMMKAYEAERALEAMPSDAIYENTEPTTKSGFRGLDRFKLGQTDLMTNINALLLEQSSKDRRIGRVVHEFLLRTKRSHSVFSRMDQSRIALDVDEIRFSDCWSFYEKPKPRR